MLSLLFTLAVIATISEVIIPLSVLVYAYAKWMVFEPIEMYRELDKHKKLVDFYLPTILTIVIIGGFIIASYSFEILSGKYVPFLSPIKFGFFIAYLSLLLWIVFSLGFSSRDTYKHLITKYGLTEENARRISLFSKKKILENRFDKLDGQKK
jgi:hypothetical protein